MAKNNEKKYVNRCEFYGTVHKIFQKTDKYCKFCLKIMNVSPKGNEFASYLTVKSFDKQFAKSVEEGDKILVEGSMNTESFNNKMYTYCSAESIQY